MKVQDIETGKIYTLLPTQENINAALAGNIVPVETRPETLSDWAQRIGYPHPEERVRVITRLPRSGKYDSYDKSSIEDIQANWPNRRIIGAHDVNGEWVKAPNY